MSKIASSLVVTAALTLAVADNVGAQQQQQQKQTAPDTDHVKALIEQAKVRLNVPTDATQAPAATQGAKVDLTADEAVARALERNLTLASQRLTPQTFDYSLAASRAFYRPNVTSQVSNN